MEAGLGLRRGEEREGFRAERGDEEEASAEEGHGSLFLSVTVTLWSEENRRVRVHEQ